MADDRTLVIYHGGGCFDGFCAAWLLRKAYPDAELVPAQHGEPPPDVAGKRVIIADFSYKRPVLAQMCREAIHVTLLDHHATAKKDLMPVVEELATVQQVPLSDGTFAYVDAADLGVVTGYSWSRAKNGGAIAYAGGGRADPKMVYMHRLITNAPSGVLVDHRNRLSTDNRRSNLRFATRQQNAANMDRGSEWKGVTHRESSGSWVAQIMIDYEHRYLGSFATAEEAARTYDAAAREAFGEFARCNFGEPDEPFPANCTIVFDLNKSGGRLVWEWLYEREKHSLTPFSRWLVGGNYFLDAPPWLVAYTEDRDLWRWAVPHSHDVNAALRSYPLDFTRWDQLEMRDPLSLAAEGVAINRRDARVVESHVGFAREIDLDGHKVLAVNATTLTSEIAGELAKDRPFGVCWFRRADGQFIYSLRSRAGGVDVSEVAKRHGGGGHAAAAGFQSPTLIGA